MGTSGYEEIREETVQYENGKPIRHVKIVKRDLSPEEAAQVIERDRKIWRDFDDAFQDFDQKNMFASLKHAMSALRERLRKGSGGSHGG